MIVPDMSVWRAVLVLVAVFVFDRADAAGCSKGSDCTAVQGQYCHPTSDQCMDTPAGYVRSSESKGYTICGAGSFTHHDANNLKCQACVPGFTAPRGSTNIKQCQWQDDKKPTEVHPLQTFFDAMDTDGSRSIDTEELFATMKAHGFESITTLDGARHWVIFYDSDNNGKVDWNEFTGAYTNVEESMTDAQVASKTMQMTDTNKDGKISQDEAEAMSKRFGMVLTDSYQNLLKADTDSDGQVSEDELVEVFKHRHPAELDIMETLSSEIDFKNLLAGNGVDKDRRLLPLPKLGPLFQKQNVDGRHDQFGKWLTPASAVSTECMLNDTFAALRNAGVYNSGNCSITVQEAAYGTFSITVWSTELATLKLFSEDDYAHCQENTYKTRAATFTWTPPRHIDHEYEATFYALCQPVDLAMANASADGDGDDDHHGHSNEHVNDRGLCSNRDNSNHHLGMRATADDHCRLWSREWCWEGCDDHCFGRQSTRCRGEAGGRSSFEFAVRIKICWSWCGLIGHSGAVGSFAVDSGESSERGE